MAPKGELRGLLLLIQAGAAAPEDDWTYSVCLSAGADALQLASSPPQCMSQRPPDTGTWGLTGEVEGHSFLTAKHGKRPQGPFYHADFLHQDSPPPLLQQILASFISNTCLLSGL